MNTPAPYSLRDISALLPCGEQDFVFSSTPRAHARPSRVAPALVGTPSRSLFVVLIQAHNLWGQVARRACQWESDFLERGPEPRAERVGAGGA